MELSRTVKEKLVDLMEVWADENLPGRPAILGYAIYSTMEETLLEKQKEIEETFPL